MDDIVKNKKGNQNFHPQLGITDFRWAKSNFRCSSWVRTERHRKLQKRNMPHLQSQRTTYHHRSQQTYHQFLRRHFQPKQEQLPGPSWGGHWDFRFCGFGYFLDGFFGFCVFFGFGSLRFADFLSFSIWFSVFTKSTNGLSDLISDTVFGFSYLTYLGSGFSSIWTAITRLHCSRIAAKRKC